MKYGPPNRDVRVFSEKMTNASISHETEYALFMKSKNFASSRRPRARANDPDVVDENFRGITVNLPSQGVLASFFFLPKTAAWLDGMRVYDTLVCAVYTHCVY